MARFRRVRREDDGDDRMQVTHAEVNNRMQQSAQASIGGGLGDAVGEAVMSGVKVVISMVALVIVLWLLTLYK